MPESTLTVSPSLRRVWVEIVNGISSNSPGIASPSLRRVWVEIYRIKNGEDYDDNVTLLAEGVG